MKQLQNQKLEVFLADLKKENASILKVISGVCSEPNSYDIKFFSMKRSKHNFAN